jgi:4-methyl-5(b-hydroxyethyl)-thiazole monophosphate biosynthesis
MEAELKGANVVYDKVTKAGNIITSRGMGTAIPFGLEIVASLIDKETADKLGKTVVYN